MGVKKKDEIKTLKWRLDKKMCGPSMIMAEIGTHSYHLLRYVSGLEAKEVSAEINSLSPELSVDDNAFLTLRMNNNARASIWVSSTATGGENGLKIRVYGTKGAVEWFQDEPNNLKFTPLNKSSRIITRANNDVSNFSLESSRLAAGHPEGFFEAFALKEIERDYSHLTDGLGKRWENQNRQRNTSKMQSNPRLLHLTVTRLRGKGELRYTWDTSL